MTARIIIQQIKPIALWQKQAKFEKQANTNRL